MSLTAWPVALDVTAVLPASIPSTAAQSYIDGIVADVEDRTGYNPFLADSDESFRLFFPPDPRSGRTLLDLKGGVISVSSVVVDYYPDNPSSGTELIAGTEYNLLPQGNADHGKPYNQILFGRNGPDFQGYYGYGQSYDFRYFSSNPSIKVTGVWGFGLNVPADLWNAVRDLAAAMCVRQAQRATGQVQKLRQGERQIEFATGNTGTFLAIEDAETALYRAIMKYQRL